MNELLKKRLVAIMDTSTDMLCCAVGEMAFDQNDTPCSFELLAARDHSCRRKANTELTLTLEQALQDAHKTREDIECVVVGRGPGSFTGVRIGIASAKGIACAALCPLYGASTLDACAFSAWKAGVRGRLGVVGDAMRGEVYPGLYQLDNHGIERVFSVETVVKAHELPKLWDEYRSDCDFTLTGDGLIKYKTTFEQAGFNIFADDSAWWPSSEGLLYSLCTPSMHSQPQNGDPALVLPIYTRLSDAEETERKRLGIQESVLKSSTGCAEGLANIHLQLRPMSINDVAQVADLEKRAFSGSSHTSWTQQMFLDDMSLPGHIWWVAHDMGRIIGFAGGTIAGDTCFVSDVACDKAYRRQGVAARLLMRVAYDALMLGATEITLEVDTENSAAQSLYKRLGFEESGIRKDYYAPQKDAHIMTSKLPLVVEERLMGERPEPKSTGHSWPVVKQRRSRTQFEAIKQKGTLILAIESSCDETAMAIVTEENEVLASVVATQIDFHARFGGVVPEIASRKHTEALVGVFEETMKKAGEALGVPALYVDDLSAIAVTSGPGLVGALVVGVAFAKGLCAASGLPLISVNHLEGHLFANLFETPDLTPPFVASLISGGNTMLILVRDWGDYEVLGATIDDAVGEAFDKVAKALGLGYPGGPIISKLAAQGNPKAIRFPRAMMHSHDYRFSLSGLKTSVITYIQNENKAGRPINLPDLAASFEAAVIDVQVQKAVDAVMECNVRDFCAGGGVTANPSLRQAYKDAFGKLGIRVTVPPFSACTDNAAMIGLAAFRLYKQKDFADLCLDANPNMALPSKSS